MFGQLICKCGKPAIHTFRFPGKEWFCPSCEIASPEFGGHGEVVYRGPTPQELEVLEEQSHLFKAYIARQQEEPTNATP